MTEKRRIFVLGRKTINDDEDEILRDIGRAMAFRDRQLVTAKIAGVCQAVAWGFNAEGGNTEYITTGTIPDSNDVIVFGDRAYNDRIRAKVPDADERGWIMLAGPESVSDFYERLIEVLAEQGHHRPKVGAGKR